MNNNPFIISQFFHSTGILLTNHDCSRRHSQILFSLLSEKIILDISCESSAMQRIHMKHQALFSSKEKSKNIRESSAAFFFSLAP